MARTGEKAVATIDLDKLIKEATSGPSVMIGVPLGMDYQIDVRVCLWVQRMCLGPNRMSHYATTRYSQQGRNQVIFNVLNNIPQVTHIFFVDSDTLPPIDAIERLLAHDKDIVAGVTPMFVSEVGGPCWSVMAYDEHVRADDKFKPILYNDLPKEVFRAHLLGGSTILIKRRVLEKMSWPYFDAIFTPQGLKLGPDLYFTAKAKKYGFQLWCDPTVRCEHARYGEYLKMFGTIYNDYDAQELIMGKESAHAKSS